MVTQQPRPEPARLTSAFRVLGPMEAEVKQVGHSFCGLPSPDFHRILKKNPEEALRNACESVPLRLRKVINTDGGYIEKWPVRCSWRVISL